MLSLTEKLLQENKHCKKSQVSTTNWIAQIKIMCLSYKLTFLVAEITVDSTPETKLSKLSSLMNWTCMFPGANPWVHFYFLETLWDETCPCLAHVYKLSSYFLSIHFEGPKSTIQLFTIHFYLRMIVTVYKHFQDILLTHNLYFLYIKKIWQSNLNQSFSTTLQKG